MAACSVAYLGAFTADYRRSIAEGLRKQLLALGLPHTHGCGLIATLADPVVVRGWAVCGLPSDGHSIENALIMSRSRRWPLLIDPQGQANRFIRAMGKDPSYAPNGLEVLKPSDKRFLQTVENAIRFGR